MRRHARSAGGRRAMRTARGLASAPASAPGSAPGTAPNSAPGSETASLDGDELRSAGCAMCALRALMRCRIARPDADGQPGSEHTSDDAEAASQTELDSEAGAEAADEYVWQTTAAEALDQLRDRRAAVRESGLKTLRTQLSKHLAMDFVENWCVGRRPATTLSSARCTGHVRGSRTHARTHARTRQAHDAA